VRRAKLCSDPMRRRERWKRLKEKNRLIVKSLSSSDPATLWSDVSSKRKIPQCPKNI